MSPEPSSDNVCHAFELPIPQTLAQQHADCRQWLTQQPLYQANVHSHLAIALTLSEYLFETARFRPDLFAEQILSWDMHQPFHTSTFSDWENACLKVETETDLHFKLREWRKVIQWRSIIRDALGLATVEETYHAVSSLARSQLATALNWLQGHFNEKWGTPLTSNGEPMSLIVLGMGKLGSGELNLSSDIDLIFAYPEGGELEGKRQRSYQEYFERVGQKLIQALDKPIATEQAFRVDMRLRPYGQSGPLVMSFQAMEVYYRDQGREWERFAMTRVAQVAGDLKQGKPLLDMLKAFAFRRYLDYGIIDALRSMKRQIEAEGRRGLAQEQNIKLGPGGIREVEFIAQALQLIRGGQDPRLQDPRIVPLLTLIADEHLLPRDVCEELSAAYPFYRRVEHALQAFRDEQTQTLPETITQQSRLAWHLGFSSWEALTERLQRHRSQVNHHFKAFIQPPSQLEESDEVSPWISLWENHSDSDHCFATALGKLKTSPSVVKMRARSRERLDQFMPQLLNAIHNVEPESGALPLLERILPLIEAIARRSAYLVLLMENPKGMQLLVHLCQASSWIASTLTKYPLLLDELLDPDYLYQQPTSDSLRAELNQRMLRIPIDDLEYSMDALRHFVQAHQFHAAASEVMGKLPLMKVSDYLTWLAEVILERCLALAWAQLVDKYGNPCDAHNQPVHNPEFLILGYGKLGGLEMGYASDLDLVFIHDAIEGSTQGERPIDNRLFYTRLGHRIVHILTTLTAAGTLYEADLRLRPDGASGVIVTSLRGFKSYQETDAWTWEHQALLRARPIVGHPRIAQTVEDIRQSVLSRKRDVEKLRAEVAAMRQKMRHNLGTGAPGDERRFDVKHDAGGLIDIEFLVQFGALAWSSQDNDRVRYTDNMRLLDEYHQAGWITADEAESLQQAYLTYRTLIHRQTLQNQPAIFLSEDLNDDIKQRRHQVIELWHRYIKDTN